MFAESDQQNNVHHPCVIRDARRVLERLAKHCSQPQGFGSFSISIYDTAWLAMLRDPQDSSRWLFPQSYSYLLQHQGKDGMWPTYASPIDGILNTLAGLLALVKHHKTDTITEDTRRSGEEWTLSDRINKAYTALQASLSQWDVGQTLHVGFEMLVPALLRQLGDEGFIFEFEGQKALVALHEAKLARFHPEMMTSKQPTTLLHSLEAFIGVFDFGLLRHHCSVHGGMLGSPASTSAYLLHSPEWDDRAQKYLENVVSSYQSCGGVPSGFPTPVFEVSWIISTLLDSGFNVDDFDRGDISIVGEYLRKAIVREDGILGFMPDIVPDADDTAKTLLALTALGVHVDRTSLVTYFEGSNHFKTYQLERTPSASANCNVLLALLTSLEVDQYAPQIDKALNYLYKGWNTNALQDKWNLADEYTYMLLASSLVQLLIVYDQGFLRSLAPSVVEVDVPVMLIQLLARALAVQETNGSWQGSVERTSYAALLISSILRLPWPFATRHHALAALQKAKEFLAAHSDDWATGDYLWIEKVTYKLPILAETYCLSAMNSSGDVHSWMPEMEQIFQINDIKLRKMTSFFGRLPLLKGLSEASVTLAVHEAAMYSNSLKQVRLDVFDRDGMPMSADKYLDYIPIAWTTINAVNGFALSKDEMWEMMVISMLNFQVDEYMESVVARLTEPNSRVLGAIIGAEICHDGKGHSTALRPTLSNGSQPVYSELSVPPALEGIVETMSRYLRHVRSHPALVKSPPTAQLRVMQELEKFLLAHMAHNADNARLRSRRHGAREVASWCDQTPYYDWTRTTGANDTSCPYSFEFFCCLISNSGSHCLNTMEQKYLAREMCSHLATLCRQYNDLGSATRDEVEGNLNSLDFPEFSGREHSGGGDNSLEKRKELLMKVADIERLLLQLCWDRLSNSLDKTIRGKMNVFINVTDLFGQIYLVRDLASRVQT